MKDNRFRIIVDPESFAVSESMAVTGTLFIEVNGIFFLMKIGMILL